jgi:hypothetical protein
MKEDTKWDRLMKKARGQKYHSTFFLLLVYVFQLKPSLDYKQESAHYLVLK